MRELPDYADLSVPAGAPVTTETLNRPSLYADVFRDQFGVEHRVDDFEHAAPLAPQAAAFFRWGGEKYEVVGASNIKDIWVNGPGDVTIELTIAARTDDWWFPRVDIQRTVHDRPGLWWEYDDGARSASRCRLRFVERVGGDLVSAHADFLFQAWMKDRALGDSGVGGSNPVAVRDVRPRICVDGAEAAELRTDLLEFCAAHRERWLAGHDREGRHLQPQYALAAFQIERPVATSEDGPILWKSGPLDDLLWRSWDSSPTTAMISLVRFEVAQGKRWRSALLSWRIANHDPPKVLKLAIRRLEYGAWSRVGDIGLDPSGGVFDDSYWLDVKSLGVVLTGMP